MSDFQNDEPTTNADTIMLPPLNWRPAQVTFDQLASLLLESGDRLELTTDPIIRDALLTMPESWFEHQPRLLVLQAQLKAHVGENFEAIQLYEKAVQSYQRTQSYTQQIKCFLDLARIYHRLEDLEAARFYTDHAHDLLLSLKVAEPTTVAELHLSMARLAPDIGRMEYSAPHAEKALHLYESVGEVPSQLEAILLLAGAANQTGYIQKALSLLRIAKARRTVLENPDDLYWELAMDNQEAHCLWYLGKLQLGAQVAEKSIALADTLPQTKQRIYLRLLLGNIYRGQRRYHEAHICYDEAESLLEPLNYTLYRVWIQAHRAWLHALEGEITTARQEFYYILANCDHGQAMSFNVFLAAIYTLDQKWNAAEQLLYQSLNFYKTSGDFLSVCAIHSHLAYIALQRQKITKAKKCTTAALTWLAEHNLSYFPHWWHDQIMLDVTMFALDHSICPATAEQILHGPLYQDMNLFTDSRADASIATKLPGIDNQFSPTPPVDLSFADNLHARKVLEKLLNSGWLRAERFEALKTLLVTGKRSRPNATFLATFGLYLQGQSRHSIATRLAIAEATVRTYITLAYEKFNISNSIQMRNRQRFTVLLQKVRQEGYINDES